MAENLPEQLRGLEPVLIESGPAQPVPMEVVTGRGSERWPLGRIITGAVVLAVALPIVALGLIDLIQFLRGLPLVEISNEVADVLKLQVAFGAVFGALITSRVLHRS